MATVRLDEKMEQKLQILSRMGNTSKSEIIKRAITAYYEREVTPKTAFEIGEELFGEFGRYEGHEDLSTTYKQRLKDKLNEKHAR